ncbi:MAG: hypothetical protein ABIG32_02560 [Candidatus Uhrbacteria bacterium]|nr:hypothetical protein [Patescibacteria group bacterium]
MNELLVAIALLIGIFAAAFIVAKIFLKHIRFCIICVAVFMTWAILLVSKIWFGYGDPVILAIFMGESVTGGMYLFGKNMPSGSGKNMFRLLWIAGGTIIVAALLRSEWIWIFFGAALLAAAWLIRYKDLIRPNKKPPSKALAEAKSTINVRDELEDCCGD